MFFTQNGIINDRKQRLTLPQHRLIFQGRRLQLQTSLFPWERRQTTDRSSGCKLRTRCEWRIDFRRLRNKKQSIIWFICLFVCLLVSFFLCLFVKKMSSFWKLRRTRCELQKGFHRLRKLNNRSFVYEFHSNEFHSNDKVIWGKHLTNVKYFKFRPPIR